MKFYLKLLVSLTTVALSLSSCISQSFFDVTPVTTIERVTETPTKQKDSQATPLSFSDIPPSSSKIELQCSVYKRLGWGEGPLDFGSPHDYHLVNIDTGSSFLPPPVFNQAGDLFVYDVVNRRIMKFTATKINPTAFFLSDKEYVTERKMIYENGLHFGSFSVTSSHMVVHYQHLNPDNFHHRLSYINYSGKVEYDIPISPSIALISPVILADQWGAIYMQTGNSFVYTVSNPGFLYISPPSDKKQEQVFIKAGIEEPFFVGWDNYLYHITDHTFYHKSASHINYRRWEIFPDMDYWNNPTKQESVPSLAGGYKRIIGIDRSSNLYVEILSENESYLIKVNTAGKAHRLIGIFPQESPFDTIVSSSISPDGTYFGITYDANNSKILPNIIKCEFPVRK